MAPPPPPSGGVGVSGGGSGIGQLLRDPEHYEEISVIGNGELMETKCEKSLSLMSVLLTFICRSMFCAIIDVCLCLRAQLKSRANEFLCPEFHLKKTSV